MSEMTITQAANRKPTEYFLSKGGKSIYRRGVDGLCISSDGRITSIDYGGEQLSKVFDNEEYYTRLYEGDVITITL